MTPNPTDPSGHSHAARAIRRPVSHPGSAADGAGTDIVETGTGIAYAATAVDEARTGVAETGTDIEETGKGTLLGLSDVQETISDIHLIQSGVDSSRNRTL